MTHHQSLRAPRGLLAVGGLALVAIAGFTATQATAATGSHSRGTVHHAVFGSRHIAGKAGAGAGSSPSDAAGIQGKAGAGAAPSPSDEAPSVTDNPDSLGWSAAVTSLVPGTVSQVQDADIPVIGGPVKQSVHVVVFQLTPDGGSGPATVWLDVHSGHAQPVKVGSADNGDTAVARRTVGGKVYTAHAYAAQPGAGAVLTPDQLTQALAQLSPAG